MKTKNVIGIVIALFLFTFTLSAQETGQQWSKERTMEWQQENPWYVGFNYIPADACQHPKLEKYVKDVIGKFKNDDRVFLWGLVNGKTQTDLPWGHRPGDSEPKVWQHDLFNGDFTPYDPKEIEVIKSYANTSASKK